VRWVIHVAESRLRAERSSRVARAVRWETPMKIIAHHGLASLALLATLLATACHVRLDTLAEQRKTPPSTAQEGQGRAEPSALAPFDGVAAWLHTEPLSAASLRWMRFVCGSTDNGRVEIRVVWLIATETSREWRQR
jgi:hypothetical protein